MENRTSPYSAFLGILLLTGVFPVSSNAQETVSNRTHAFVDRFYTDDDQPVERNHSATTYPDVTYPDFQLAESVRTHAVDKSFVTSAKQQSEGSDLFEEVDQHAPIDESLVKPAPIRPLSCRPY
ncbi:MAG: hypothetical protein ACKO7B_18260 [Flavobacteriales bacterium]